MAGSDDAEALMVRIGQGDRAALAILFEAQAGRMKAIARRIVRRDDLAEEAVQDAFLAVWQKARLYDPARGAAVAWITTITRNRALNMLRDGGRLETHDEESLAELGDREADAMAAFDRLAERDALRGCLATLDMTKRKAILLCYVVGMSHGETAATLKAPLGTVKAWIRRGMIALQECLA